MTIEDYIDEKVSESEVLNEPTIEWLKSYSKKSAVYSNIKRFETFLAWIKKTDVELVQEYKDATDKDEWSKEMGKTVVEYFNHLVKNNYATNTARAMTSVARAFFTNQCTSLRVRRKAIPKARKATGEHIFSQEELRKMFFVADVRDKAVLSTATALGFSANDFLNLKRKLIENLVDKALSENKPFISFEYTREKTGATSYSTLTPEAINSLKAWLDISNKESEWLWHNHTAVNHITGQALNDILKKLVQKANIQTVGQVKFHLLRKFLMSSAVESGFNAFETKYLLGKEIPVSDSTYLVSLKRSIDEKIPQLYEHIKLAGYANHNHTRLEELEATVQKQQQAITGFIEVLSDFINQKIKKEEALTKLAELKAVERLEKATSPEAVRQFAKKYGLNDDNDNENNNS